MSDSTRLSDLQPYSDETSSLENSGFEDPIGGLGLDFRTCGVLPGAKETILFVEDEAFVREVASEVLRSSGYVVLAARNGEDALLAFHQHPGKVDLLISDIVLPGKSGGTLARSLQALFPEIRILLISGYSSQFEAAECGSNAHFLAKPFSISTLLSNVRQALSHNADVVRKEPVKRACDSE